MTLTEKMLLVQSHIPKLQFVQIKSVRIQTDRQKSQVLYWVGIMPSITDELADYLDDLSYDSLPEKVVKKSNELFLDFLGVALYGSTLESGRIATHYSISLGGISESSVLGSSTVKLPAPNAAFANGVSAHSPELDDIEHEGSVHCGTTVIPAALAVGEKVHADGRMLMTSIVAGYEVTIRIARAAQGKDMLHYRKGFHPTATCGTFGSTAASGILLGLNRDQMKNAFGIAGSAAAGILEFLEDGSWSKRYGAGRAALDGVTAASLAKQGFTGPGSVLEGKRGFLSSFSDGGDKSIITNGLGREYTILQTGVKPHACCRYIQAPIDAILEMMSENKLVIDQIKSVEVYCSEAAVFLLEEPKQIKYQPNTVVDAQFSVPYSVAVTLINSRAFVDEYTDTTIHDPKILALARKVRLLHDPDLDKGFPKRWPARVVIDLMDGKRLEKKVDGARGDYEFPLTRENLEEKFTVLASKVLTDSSVNYLLDSIRTIQLFKDANDLTSKFEYRNSHF